MQQAVSLKPDELLKALESVLRKKYKVLRIWTEKGKFCAADAKYHSVTAEIACTGKWKDSAEIDAGQFKKVLMTLVQAETILLLKEDQHISIESGTFSGQIKRLDPGGNKKIKRQPLRHKGKVDHPPGPVGKRAEFSDPWGFSARVPLPAEAYEKRPKDWDVE
jgi:hypothetical protein